jgi:uncharacterized membrane protein
VAAATPLATIAGQITTSIGAHFTLRKLLDIVGSVGSGADAANAQLSVMDIVRGSMVLADTDHFASLTLTQSDLPLVPGLNNAVVKFGLIEAPQQKSGPPKDALGNYLTTAKTSQIRLSVEENLNLSLTGLGIVAVKVPYYFEAGSATASLDTLACTGSSTPDRVDIKASTSIGKVTIGAVTDAAIGNTGATVSPGNATLVNALLGAVTITTSSPVVQTIPGSAASVLSFTPDYATAASKTIPGTSTVSLPPLAAGNLTVHVVGLGLNAGTITTDLLNGITNAATPLTSSLVQPLLRSLGLSFATANVWAPPPQTCSPTSYNSTSSTTVSVPTLLR